MLPHESLKSSIVKICRLQKKVLNLFWRQDLPLLKTNDSSIQDEIMLMLNIIKNCI